MAGLGSVVASAKTTADSADGRARDDGAVGEAGRRLRVVRLMVGVDPDAARPATGTNATEVERGWLTSSLLLGALECEGSADLLLVKHPDENLAAADGDKVRDLSVGSGLEPDEPLASVDALVEPALDLADRDAERRD